MISQAPAARPKSWPNDPYKGLTFYSVDDVPLFAGRDDDIDAMTGMIGIGNTRIVLLHGMTGCGKSSFLRAGLIPTLEEEMASYEFLRDENGQPDFIRSTDDPTASLARKLHQAIRSKRLSIELPADEADFVGTVASDPEQLVTVVERLASQIRRTLVLVIDQAEEVITVKADSRGDPARLQFFDLLAGLSRTKHDLKLIIAFRTEYHGQFYAQLRYGADVSRINDYFLADFSKRQIVESILRPTSDKEIRRYGRPCDQYHFTYESGLPEKIADALLSSGVSGGVLPVMQIVCRRLYDGVKSQTIPSPAGAPAPEGTPVVITESRYTSVGGVSGQVDSHIQSELDGALKQEFARNVNVFVGRFETSGWRKVLSHLIKPQVNGTVTTDIRPVVELAKEAKEAGCRIEPAQMFDYLEKRLILRPVDVTQIQDKQILKCYSLGHDVLASALQTWNTRRKLAMRFIWSMRVTYGVLAIFTGLNFLFFHFTVFAGILAGFILLGFIMSFTPVYFNQHATDYGRIQNTKQDGGNESSEHATTVP